MLWSNRLGVGCDNDAVLQYKIRSTKTLDGISPLNLKPSISGGIASNKTLNGVRMRAVADLLARSQVDHPAGLRRGGLRAFHRAGAPALHP